MIIDGSKYYYFNIWIIKCQFRPEERTGWMRFFGKGGFSWKPVSHGLYFSQRYGYRKTIKLFG